MTQQITRRVRMLVTSVLITFSITTNPIIASEALAWKIMIGGKTIAKGKDIKVKIPGVKIPTMQQAFESVVHSIDTNFKGLDQAIKRNTQTLAHVGRAGACWATWCLSEAYRAYKIEESRKKLKEELKNYKERELAQFAQKAKEDQIQALKGEIEKIDALIAAQNESLSLGRAHLEILTSLAVAFGTEARYRELLAQNGVAPAPLNENLRPISERFETALRSEDQEAFDKLNEEIRSQSAVSGVAIEEVMNDVIAFMSDSTLAQLDAQNKLSLESTRAAVSKIQAEQVATQAERNQVQSVLTSLTSPPPRPGPRLGRQKGK